MKYEPLKEYCRIAGYILLGMIIGFLLGILVGIFLTPEQVIIIKDLPPETLPAIIKP